ncbi:MAG TPA: alpha/beta hydrolase [Anaerolineae bacterium]|nr:alpha/beta hydrolase [Anaerolineae bacterium]
MKSDNSLRLPDGRTLSYAEFGRPEGYPVLFFHGTPGSRLQPLVFAEDSTLARLGLRLIAPDRPGLGRSDFQPKRGFSDYPADVVALANALGVDRFAVLGGSGGGPYAVACAVRMPERLSAVVIVSGGWPMNVPEAWENLAPSVRRTRILASKGPFLLGLLQKLSWGTFKDSGDKTLAKFTAGMPAPDRAVLEQPGRLERALKDMGEAMHQGTRGAVWDMRLSVRDWDFHLDDVRMPLKLFHGEQDNNVPIALVRKVMGALPGAQLVAYKNEGHWSTPVNHLDEIAQALMAD